MALTYRVAPPSGNIRAGQRISIALDQVASIDWKLMEVDLKAESAEHWGRGESLMLVHLTSGKVEEFDWHMPLIEFVCGEER